MSRYTTEVLYQPHVDSDHPWLVYIREDGNLWDVAALPTAAKACLYAARRLKSLSKESGVAA